MGRHSAGGPAEAGTTPRGAELLGWGLFTLALTVGVLVWRGVGWPVVAGVGGAVVLGIGVVWVVAALGRSREGTGPPS